MFSTIGALVHSKHNRQVLQACLGSPTSIAPSVRQVLQASPSPFASLWFVRHHWRLRLRMWVASNTETQPNGQWRGALGALAGRAWGNGGARFEHLPDALGGTGVFAGLFAGRACQPHLESPPLGRALGGKRPPVGPQSGYPFCGAPTPYGGYPPQAPACVDRARVVRPLGLPLGLACVDPAREAHPLALPLVLAWARGPLLSRKAPKAVGQARQARANPRRRPLRHWWSQERSRLLFGPGGCLLRCRRQRLPPPRRPALPCYPALPRPCSGLLATREEGPAVGAPCFAAGPLAAGATCFAADPLAAGAPSFAADPLAAGATCFGAWPLPGAAGSTCFGARAACSLAAGATCFAAWPVASAFFQILYSREVPIPKRFRMSPTGSTPRRAAISWISACESSVGCGMVYTGFRKRTGLPWFAPVCTSKNSKKAALPRLRLPAALGHAWSTGVPAGPTFLTLCEDIYL